MCESVNIMQKILLSDKEDACSIISVLVMWCM